MPCNRNVTPEAPIDRPPTQGSHRGGWKSNTAKAVRRNPSPNTRWRTSSASLPTKNSTSKAIRTPARQTLAASTPRADRMLMSFPTVPPRLGEADHDAQRRAHGTLLPPSASGDFGWEVTQSVAQAGVGYLAMIFWLARVTDGSVREASSLAPRPRRVCSVAPRPRWDRDVFRRG